MSAPSNVPPHRTPSPQHRQVSPQIRTYVRVGVHGAFAQAGQAFDAIAGRTALSKPENAALFAILIELKNVMGHPDPQFDELRQLIDDLEYLKGLEASR